MDSPHAWFTSAIGQYLLLVWAMTCAGAIALLAGACIRDTAQRAWHGWRGRRADRVRRVGGFGRAATMSDAPVPGSEA